MDKSRFMLFGSKNKKISEALRKLNWSQTELARRCKINPTLMNRFINLRKRLSDKEIKKLKDVFNERKIHIEIRDLDLLIFNKKEDSKQNFQTKKLSYYLPAIIQNEVLKFQSFALNIQSRNFN